MSVPLVKIIYSKHTNELEVKLQKLVEDHGMPSEIKMQDNGVITVILAVWAGGKIDVV